MAIASFDLSNLNGVNGFVLKGIDAGDYSGVSVSSAGDFNGDGIDDLIIGAYFASQIGGSRAGESYVVFGTTAGFGANIDLSSLDGTSGFVLNGRAFTSGESGRSVDAAGDVNGDGIDDLIIGAPGDPTNSFRAGASFVVFGTTTGFGSSLDLSSLDGANGFALDGFGSFEFSGTSVAAAGDVNGDGIGDVIVGAYGAAAGGQSYVVFGTTAGFGASLVLSSLDGINGFALIGVDFDDYSGKSVSTAGDINGDGIDDLVIGAPGADPNGASLAGETYVVFGRTSGFGASVNLSSLNGTNGFILNGVDAGGYSGYSVSSAGDVNGDGINDIVIGAPQAGRPGAGEAGESYVVFGTSAGFAASLDLSALDGTNGFVLNGVSGLEYSGNSVAAAGDINGDGVDDLIVGASRATANGQGASGESYVVFGTTAGFGANFDLSSLDGINGFTINGVDSGDYSGRSVSAAGDVNGDGIDDIIIGASSADPNGQSQAGESYVIFGSTAFGADVDATGFDDVLQGNGAGNEFTGLEGDDTLFGLVGNDTLRGGEDNDTLIGGAGVDQFDGGAGTDTADYSASNGVWVSLFGTQLFGEAAGETFTSVENLVGSSFSDTLEGDNGANVLSARNGSDRLKGAGGADLLLGGAGDDNLDGGAGLDTLDGGSGTDAADYQNFGGGVSVNLSAGTALSGGALNASGFYAGGALEDILVGIEDVIGTPFADRLVAISTGSRLLGQNGSDRLSGLGGRDLLIGGEGDDTLEGGGNSDTLSGGVGFDLIDGGTGLDTASYSDFATGGLSVNVINGVALSGGFVNASGFYQGGATEDAIVNVENIIGSDFTDRLVAGSTSAEVDGRGGNDVISTFSGNDTIFGGEGDDRIGAGQSTDQLFGGNGNDTLNGGTGLDTLDGGGNIDTADYSDRTGGVSVNLVSGSALTGGALNASGFYGGGFTEDSLVSIEAVIGTAFGDRLVAGLFASRLEGRGGHDNISGLTGDDTVAGGAGNDTLSGGDGNDTFEFAPGFGADRITDFAEGAGAGDVIRFVGFGLAFDSFAEVIAVASQAGGDVVFDFGGGNTITVASATVAGFAADDFSFG